MANKRNNKYRRNGKSERSEEVTRKADCSMPHVITNSKASNDPSWYTNIYPLPKDVASLSFNIPSGQIFDATVNAQITYPTNWNGLKFSYIDPGYAYGFNSVPGIMVFETAPTIGKCLTPNDAANIAAQQEYTLVRKANSGAINYDKTDLMMLNVAMDSAYMLYEYLLRAYRTFGMYAVMNRYMPDALLNAQGFSPSLSTDLANFRTALDMFAYSLGSINIPDQFDFIKRHSWMYTHVYKDSPLEKASLYLLKPDGMYVWTEGVDAKPTYLKYYQLHKLFGLENDTQMITSIDQIQLAINTVMKPLLGSQDVGTISGDVAKAFGEGGMIKIRPVEDHEALVPVYDLEVISQLENATIMAGRLYNPDIVPYLEDTVAGPYLRQDLRVHNVNGVKKFYKPLLNLHSESPSPEEVMVATRLIATVGDPIYDEAETTKSLFRIGSCGTEIVTGCQILQYSMTRSATPVKSIHGIDVLQETPVGDSQDAQGQAIGPKAYELANRVTNLSAFSHHPTVYLFGAQSKPNSIDVSTPGIFAGTIQDFDNYVWLEESTIARLNDAAVLSEFAVKDYPMF